MFIKESEYNGYSLKLTPNGLYRYTWRPVKRGYTLLKTTTLDLDTLELDVQLDPDVRLKHIFALMHRIDPELLAILFKDHYTGEYLDEYYQIIYSKNKKLMKPYTGEYAPDGIEFIELYWQLYQETDYFKRTKHPELLGFRRPNVHGLGFKLKKDKATKEYLKGEGQYYGTPGNRITWGISLEPLQNLLNLPVKINPLAELYMDDELCGSGPLNTWFMSMTLRNVIDAIFWELSFHGGPEAKIKFKDTLHGMLDDIKGAEQTDLW